MQPQLCKPQRIAREVYGLTDPREIKNKVMALSRQCKEGLIPEWAFRKVGIRYEYRLDYFIRPEAPPRDARDRVNPKLRAFI
jgi:hypothetical protein